MSNKPIKYFFYNGCPHCARFSKMLTQSPKSIRNQVESLSTADTRTKALIANKYPQVESVPSVVLQNGQTLTGTNAFDWLKNQMVDSKEIVSVQNNIMTKIVVGSLLAAAIWFFYIKKTNKVAGLE